MDQPLSALMGDPFLVAQKLKSAKQNGVDNICRCRKIMFDGLLRQQNVYGRHCEYGD